MALIFTSTAAVVWSLSFVWSHLAIGKRSARESVDVRRAGALHREARWGRWRNGSHGSHGHRRHEGGRGCDEGSGSAEEHLGGDHGAAVSYEYVYEGGWTAVVVVVIIVSVGGGMLIMRSWFLNFDGVWWWRIYVEVPANKHNGHSSPISKNIWWIRTRTRYPNTECYLLLLV